MGCEIRPTLTDFRWSELAGKLADDGDPLIRLERISHFIGGNRSVLDEGMARLGLAMPGGYQRDQGKDTASGEYNPLNAGIWDYDTIEAMLKSRIGISALPEEAEAKILKDEFGSGYTYFITCQKASVSYDAMTAAEIQHIAPTFVDPENPVLPSASAMSRASSDVEAGNGYFVRIEASQWTTPWCAWNTASTGFRVLTGGGNSSEVVATSVTVKLFDKNTNLTITKETKSYVDAYGNSDFGWFPHTFSCTTHHEVEYPYISGGKFTADHSWF